MPTCHDIIAQEILSYYISVYVTLLCHTTQLSFLNVYFYQAVANPYKDLMKQVLPSPFNCQGLSLRDVK